jgi:hypothetical protein
LIAANEAQPHLPGWNPISGWRTLDERLPPMPIPRLPQGVLFLLQS